MQVLITRPKEDSGPLAAALASRGVTPVREPLMTIRAIAGAAVALDGVQAVLFTSANGARAFARLALRRDLPVFAVGDATAQTARTLGFSKVASAAGDVDDLAELVAKRLDPRRGALFHAAGSVVAGDVAARLAQAGFRVDRVALYSAEPVAALTPASVAALRGQRIAAALFFSPRTAAHFVNLARAAEIDGAFRHVAAFSLSPAVAAALAPLDWAQVIIAAAPEQEALLTAFDGFLAAWRAPDTTEG